MNHRLTSLLLMLFGALSATAAEPLYLQAPYDEVKLDETNGNTLLKVKPLNLPERKVPAVANRRGDLELEMIERPGENFAIPWLNVVDVKLFEERVLAEAEQQVAAGHYDEAQASFRFLETKYPQLPKLGEAIEKFLWQQIGGSFRAGKPDETLALLVELHRRNPNRPGLSTAFERTTSELVKARIAAGNYRGARGLLTSLAKRFPEAGATVSAPFHTQLQQQAEQLLAQAQAASVANRWSDAHRLCSQALDVWPRVAGGSPLSQQIHGRYPVVTIGVIGASSSLPATENALASWPARRANQLVATPLVNMVDSEKGLTYRSEFGQIVPQADTQQFLIRLAEGASAVELARCLKPSDEAKPFVSAIRARNAQDLLIEFQQPQLRPGAWLRFCTQQLVTTEQESPAMTGQYKIADDSFPLRTYQMNGTASAANAAPQIIRERTFADATPALLALRRGQISLLDRVPPWELRRLRTMSDVRVVPYAIPTVHLLIPNPNKQLLASRTFRRALLYALDRESILKQGLLVEQQIPGCEVISGPFPLGAEREAWSYAYNAEVKPRAYDPSLAIMLLEVARGEATGGKPAAIVPPLVLAHDDQPTAKIACESIARQLARIGQPVTLKQIEGDEAATDADLRYVEVAIQEPLVDAWALLGPGGLTGACSPLMLEHLRSLDAAADWPSATARLRAMHRLAAAELPVIPLWQTTNHLVVHSSLKGLADRPVSLYEDVQRWQIAWQKPQE
ncbi:Bacterial extracellular solute-binding protein, family 5 Middle [Anatilimnocola aggregata]|uniref:Bacterial extracellular solute-binding protein, family 5 Middle n=1 Tax=Anatilimnocola aggregata TaxID=2528021 RepID=A0A517YDC4_9BACT|nr:ABC transporter substrate-binding protein [Anatilimnocola aggregata]QDU28189.1 Bacterial extracellular solute-binding protein, family 5 Middle [Anatilimnocola aggregata]